MTPSTETTTRYREDLTPTLYLVVCSTVTSGRWYGVVHRCDQPLYRFLTIATGPECETPEEARAAVLVELDALRELLSGLVALAPGCGHEEMLPLEAEASDACGDCA